MKDRFTIVVDDAELNYKLSRAAAKLSGDTLLSQVGAVLERRINIRFDRKVDPNGTSWKALSQNTVALYLKQDGVIDGKGKRRGTLLERTGLMRASLATNVLPNAVEVGFSMPYAQYHETGTKTKKGAVRMPRRALLTADWESGRLGNADRDAILQLLQKHLDGLFD